MCPHAGVCLFFAYLTEHAQPDRWCCGGGDLVTGVGWDQMRFAFAQGDEAAVVVAEDGAAFEQDEPFVFCLIVPEAFGCGLPPADDLLDAGGGRFLEHGGDFFWHGFAGLKEVCWIHGSSLLPQDHRGCGMR